MSKFKKGDKLILITMFDRYLQPCTCIGYDSSEIIRVDFDGIQDSFHESHLQLKSEYDMQNKTETKRIPFDLERAKKGDKVITGSGKEVRILCVDGPRHATVVSIVGNMIYTHEADGTNEYYVKDDYIFMAPVEKTGWINIAKHKYIGKSDIIGSVHGTESDAYEWFRIYTSSYPDYEFICIKQITWEE